MIFYTVCKQFLTDCFGCCLVFMTELFLWSSLILLCLIACLMLLAWLFFAPIGILWMKYYTTMWPNSRIFGERYWFVVGIRPISHQLEVWAFVSYNLFTQINKMAPVAKWLRLLIFITLNRSTSHHFGFEPHPDHMWDKPSSACGWLGGFSRSPVFAPPCDWLGSKWVK